MFIAKDAFLKNKMVYNIFPVSLHSVYTFVCLRSSNKGVLIVKDRKVFSNGISALFV